MQSLFSNLRLADVQQDVMRNIVSIHVSQDLYDDLSPEPADWQTAQRAEDASKPYLYTSNVPIIDRPFEDAAWMSVIEWPFRNWQQSRFSDGSFGVWYGSQTIETTVYESAYHWYYGFLSDAGFQNQPVIGERKVYAVACQAALLDFRGLQHAHPELLDPHDYSHAKSVGSRVHREGHPGLLCNSARDPDGENFAIMNPNVLSKPRLNCQLAYKVMGGKIVVEKKPGVTWFEIDPATMG